MFLKNTNRTKPTNNYLVNLAEHLEGSKHQHLNQPQELVATKNRAKRDKMYKMCVCQCYKSVMVCKVQEPEAGSDSQRELRISYGFN